MVDMVGGFGRSCWRKVEAVRKRYYIVMELDCRIRR
jgi:hypothetical protein